VLGNALVKEAAAHVLALDAPTPVRGAQTNTLALLPHPRDPLVGQSVPNCRQWWWWRSCQRCAAAAVNWEFDTKDAEGRLCAFDCSVKISNLEIIEGAVLQELKQDGMHVYQMGEDCTVVDKEMAIVAGRLIVVCGRDVEVAEEVSLSISSWIVVFTRYGSKPSKVTCRLILSPSRIDCLRNH